MAQRKSVRWSVNLADVSILQWLEAQANVSMSLRTLVLNQIRREGYVDVAFGLIEPANHDTTPRPQTTPQVSSKKSKRRRSTSDKTSAGVSKTPSEPVPTPPAPPVPESENTSAQPEPKQPESKPKQSSASDTAQPRQMSVDEIMAATRR